MSSLLPARASKHITSGVTEYLTTSFSLADHGAAAELSSFLGAPGTGMFRGPYVRTRLPYAPSQDAERILDWCPSWFTPYHHQAEAFRRLKSVDDNGNPRRPEPTIVVTGTGSGKTESFLFPILDHVIRERAKGRTGTKALILYPMNALANDQSARLAELIAGEDADPSLSTVTAGIYTGETREGGAMTVTAKSLITSQETIRRNPPDILLTNYKMLDQLLLRSADSGIWEKSAESLQYLVLDEFHTYDGAQGTDVALLLRRLGLTLKRHQRDGFLSADDATRALGRVTPVATSATLGDGDDSSHMVDFAHTVFGEKIPATAVIREKLLTLGEWRRAMLASDGAPAWDSPAAMRGQAGMPGRDTIRDVNQAIADRIIAGDEHADAVHEEFCARILRCAADRETATRTYPHHELTGRIIDAATAAVALLPRHDGDKDNLLYRVLPADAIRAIGEDAAAEFLSHALTFIANLRAKAAAVDGWAGKRLPGVENHLWVREVSRVDRAVASTARFRWADDGHPGDAAAIGRDGDADDDGTTRHWLPACYCRNCGRSGWMIQVVSGIGDPVLDGAAIRAGALASPELQRPLLDATPEERDARSDGRPVAGPRSADGDSAVMWLNPANGTLDATEPDAAARDKGEAIPVLTYHGADAETHAKEERCPSCGETDAIRFLGSSVATLLSVALSNLFGMPDLDGEEKKTLIFADSVQDAAHRAAFVQSRSRAFALRTHTRRAIGDSTARLSELPAMLVREAGEDHRARYELLPPDIADFPYFKEFWQKNATDGKRRQATGNVLNRLAFDLALEFGDRADLARSLTMTGSVAVSVDAPADALRAAADDALKAAGATTPLDFDGALGAPAAPGAPEVLAWARGVLEMTRVRGAVNHDWFGGYLDDDCNPYLLNRRDARSRGVPGFPRGGAPEFPRVGAELPPAAAKNHQHIPIASPRSGYAKWTSRLLGLGRHDAASAVVALFKELQRRGIVDGVRTRTGAMVYAIPPERIILEAEDSPAAIECTVCRAGMGVSRIVRDTLVDTPCTGDGCSGRMHEVPIADNYYRRLYAASEPRTVIAREHTSLLEKDERLAYENAFRGADGATDPDAPNVLVATPTLEMGIDIGDLSAVMLASMPTSVASYIQRVGRAGRLSGNSLVVALMQGRGSVLAKLNEPLDVIAGDVMPPVAFLSATEILRRQFTAHLLDRLNVDAMVPGLRKASQVFGDGDGLVDALVTYIAAKPAEVREAFEGFRDSVAGHVDETTLAALGEWATGTGPNTLTRRLRDEQRKWRAEEATLRGRFRILSDKFEELEKQANTRKDDDDLADDLRATRAALGHTRKQLNDVVRDEYWVASMERYGLLPNFTLLDDSVTLKLAVSYLDPQTMEFDTERREYSRGVSSALHELVPGATFYAQGIAATIDSVDIGDAGADIERWRVCPSCSHSQVHVEGRAGAPAGSCPVCGDAKFADDGQLIPVVPLSRVSAQADRTRNAIGDRFEDRRSARFHMVLTCTIPEGGRGGSWYLPDGFGVEHLESVDLRWLNLGRGAGSPRFIGGRERVAPLFRVCRHCGHIDSEAGANSKWDHAPWCPHRDEPEEDTVAFALGRTLHTQGVLMYLPPLVAAGGEATVPSLIAAIKLGFKEVLGGDPEHLAVVTVTVGSDTGPVEALLLHDKIPGGTGYLTQFTSPEKVRDLLLRAWVRVAEEVDSPVDGPSCLTPYVDYRSLNTVTAASAESALRRILTGDTRLLADGGSDPRTSAWHPQSSRPATDDASKLEIRFRKAFREGLAARSVNVRERTRDGRVELEFTMPGDTAAWRMREQVDCKGTTPDFLLENDRMGTRPIAVYLDGYAYHASAAHMRVPGDVAKRVGLHQSGDRYIPWTMTYADLEKHDEALATASEKQPGWFNPKLVDGVAAKLVVSQTALATLSRDPLTQLFDYLMHPDWPWDRLSAAAGMLAVLSKRFGDTPGMLHGRPTTGVRVSVRPAENLHAELALDGAIWADGTDESVRRDSWKLFWNLANLMWLRDIGVEVTLDNAELFAAASGSAVEAAAAAPDDTAESPAVSADGALFDRVIIPDESGGALFAEGVAAPAAPAPSASASTADETLFADDATEASDASATDGSESIGDEWRSIIAEFDPDDADDAVIHDCFTGLAEAGVPAPDESDTEIGGAPVLALWAGPGVAITEDAGETIDILAVGGITGIAIDEVAAMDPTEFLAKLDAGQRGDAQSPEHKGESNAAADGSGGSAPPIATGDEPAAAVPTAETPTIGAEWRPIIDEFDPDNADDAVIHDCFTRLAEAGVPAPDKSDTEIAGAAVLALWTGPAIAVTEDGGETLDILSGSDITGFTVDQVADMGPAGFFTHINPDDTSNQETNAR